MINSINKIKTPSLKSLILKNKNNIIRIKKEICLNSGKIKPKKDNISNNKI
jgi:hypothetical protein